MSTFGPGGERWIRGRKESLASFTGLVSGHPYSTAIPGSIGTIQPTVQHNTIQYDPPQINLHSSSCAHRPKGSNSGPYALRHCMPPAQPFPQRPAHLRPSLASRAQACRGQGALLHAIRAFAMLFVASLAHQPARHTTNLRRLHQAIPPIA